MVISGDAVADTGMLYNCTENFTRQPDLRISDLSNSFLGRHLLILQLQPRTILEAAGAFWRGGGWAPFLPAGELQLRHLPDFHRKSEGWGEAKSAAILWLVKWGQTFFALIERWNLLPHFLKLGWFHNLL